MDDALPASEAFGKREWDKILHLSATLLLNSDPHESMDDRIASVFECIEDRFGFGNEEDVMTWSRHMVHLVNTRGV